MISKTLSHIYIGICIDRFGKVDRMTMNKLIINLFKNYPRMFKAYHPNGY